MTHAGERSTYDAIVIGAGHNGLVTAAYLARSGLQTLVLERRDRVGGALATSEIAPGMRVPSVAHTVGRLRAHVVSDLDLRSHGLRFIHPDARAFAPQPDGSAVTLWNDIGRTEGELRGRSKHDAAAYGGFDRLVRALGGFLDELNLTTPPDVESPSLGDAVAGLKLGRAFKSLDDRDAQTLLRVLPMAVADFVAESFESDALRGVIAARGVQYTAMGCWSAGTTAVLLADSGATGGAAGQSSMVRGGPGALADALASAARGFGATIETATEVARITTSNGRAAGVLLASGEEIRAQAVVSGVDPKRTLVGLVDQVALGPELAWRAGNLRLGGTVAKVNLALDRLPRFSALEGADDAERRLRGRIVIAPSVDHLERAFDASKYGQMSGEPFLEATIPSLSDDSLVTGSGGHVMSVLLQYAPYHLRDAEWDSERDAIGELALKTLESYAPGLAESVVATEVLSPLDLERDFGLTEGHPLHGELALDQFFAWRPLWGHARYRAGLDGLYLCGSGAHGGAGVTGGPGANAAREILSDLRRS